MKVLPFIFLFLLLFMLPGCRNARKEAKELIRESQELRDDGEIQEAKEKLSEALRIAPSYPETYLELGILYDEYLKDANSAAPYYEQFLKLSSNEEMRSKVSSWLKDAEEGIALPLKSVEEMPPEARELLEQRTAQYEELRRQLVNRYEGEIAKLREEMAASKKQNEFKSEEEELTVSSLDIKSGAEAKKDLAIQNSAESNLNKEKPKEDSKIAEEENAKALKKAEEEKLAALKKAEEEKLALKKAEEEKAAAEKKQKEIAEKERLEKEKIARAEKIDAFVDAVVKAGTEAGKTTTISASNLPRTPEEVGYPELELTEEEKEGGGKIDETASVEKPSGKGSELEEKQAEAAGTQAPKARVHVVEQGDNLGNISRKYYGEFRRWKDIAEANKEILPDPNKLKIGMKLVIPE